MSLVQVSVDWESVHVTCSGHSEWEWVVYMTV